MEELKLHKNAIAKLSYKSVVFYHPQTQNLKQFKEKKPIPKIDEIEALPQVKDKRTYKLNKQLIRKRLAVLFETSQFRKFKALWTLSFPNHCSNDDRYRILNIFLTRMRRDFGMCHYLWVAEYHESGFIHFHIITNVFAPVKELNAVLKASVITSAQLTGDLEDLEKAERFNGFDIADKPTKSKKGKGGMGAYVTKYITKNNGEFDRLCWYCSQSVSNLCTGVTVTQEYLDSCFTLQFITTKHDYCHQGEHFTYLSFNRGLWCQATRELHKHNQSIMHDFEELG